MTKVALPGLNCGLCGFKKCEQLEEKLSTQPEFIKRCIPLSKDQVAIQKTAAPAAGTMASREGCGMCAAVSTPSGGLMTASPEVTWRDSLGREFDFLLEHFPEDPGPREIILPHNPLITREAEVEAGDTLKVLARSDLREAIIASPAIVNNALYVRSASKLWAFAEAGNPAFGNIVSAAPPRLVQIAAKFFF